MHVCVHVRMRCMHVRMDARMYTFVNKCIAFDKAHNQQYMSMPEELAARCFEACINEHQTIKNSFLVGGLSNNNLIYPELNHTLHANEALNHYFQLLGYALHQLEK